MKYLIKSPVGDQTLTVEWPENCTRLGMLVSGGFDSALMLYLWATLDVSSDKKIIAVTTDRGRGAKEFAARIIAMVTAKTGKSIEQVILPVPKNLGHNRQVNYIAYPAMKNKVIDCDCLISAATTNPKDDTLVNGPVRLSKDKTESYTDRLWPFLHLNKTHTVSLAHQLGLDWIMELSHTCTETDGLRCSVCWQCRERAWAFSQLGLTDQGKY